MGDYQHLVTRLPGAPPRRAGLVWPLGETIAEGLTEAQAAAIALDPGYLLAVLEVVAKAAIPASPAPKTQRARRPRSA
jgi:hypothetical protein